MIDLYYWANRPNFGDAIALPLTQHFTQVETRWAAPPNARVVTCGSVLGHLPDDWNGIVCGAGSLTAGEIGDIRPFATLALRGLLTYREFKWRGFEPTTCAIGDPALLATELYPPVTDDQRYDLGVMPHWTDTELLPRIIEERKFYKGKWSILAIDPRSVPQVVVDQIACCDKIVSSSLHGIIVADAYGVPRRAERFSRMFTRYEGGEYKWHDYASMTGKPISFGRTIEVDRGRVDRAKQELFDAFGRLGRLFR